MEAASAQALKTVNLVSQELETQSLNAIVAGFSFAAAMSWMDLVRWFIRSDCDPHYPPLHRGIPDHLHYFYPCF